MAFNGFVTPQQGEMDDSVSTITDPTDSNFTSPSATPVLTTRSGRKRKIIQYDDGSDFMQTPVKRAKPKGRPKGSARKTPAAQELDENSLFGKLKRGQNVASIVEEWIAEYERNADNAAVQLLQFFVNSCGSQGQITSIMIQSMDFKVIINRLVDEYDDEATGDYPLVMTGSQWKKFRASFGDFIIILVNKCRSSIIFDSNLMDALIQLLTGLADNNLRAFRHTATFAAMKFSSAIVDVIVELSETKEKYAVQIETEKARLRRSGPSEKMETLMTSKNELDEKINDLSLMVQYLFKSVFVHRYRDVVPDIRSICVTEIGNWMRVYPALFLEDSYLKYIGWTLYDKQPEVRLKCINSILPLYERIELVDKLQLFTGKFKERLVSMVMDRETEVAIKACRLMTLVYTAFPTMLEKEDCIPLYETIYCSNRQLAVAAAEFINTKLFSTAQRRTGDVDMTPDNKQLINDLLTFYIEGEVHSHPAYLVDALMDMAPFIKDWNTMVDILLSDYSDRFDTQLVEIMTCSIKQAATGETPVGRSVVKRGAPATREQPRLLLEERTKISEVLIPKLPELLSKFIADQDKLINLTTIPLFFDLEIYPTARLTKHLDDLMSALERIVEQHTDDEVLRNVARVIMHFSTNVAVAQHTEPARLKLIDTISLQLVSGLRRFLATEERLDDEDEAALLASVRKMSAFNAVMDMRKWDVWDLTAQMLRQTHKFEGADLIDKGILLLYEMLAWDIKRIVLDGEVNRETIDRTVKRRDEFLDTIEEIMGEQGGGVETSYLCLCDALILLSWKLPVENPQLAPLVIDLNRQFIHRINMFVVDNVFVDVNDQNYRDLDEQAQIQLMYKKRNLLGQFCKLIIHGVLPVTDAALVLRNYISHYQDFGDMLKALLHKCRDIDRVGCARAMSLALVSVYDEIKTQNNTETVDPDSEQFENLKELAKKFAQSFGTDALKNRDALAMINKDGIAHALELQEKTNRRRNFRPANVSFLELLTEFSAKLLRQDKIAVLKYLEKHTPVSVETIAEDPVWQPYLFYKESLAVNKG